MNLNNKKSGRGDWGGGLKRGLSVYFKISQGVFPNGQRLFYTAGLDSLQGEYLYLLSLDMAHVYVLWTYALYLIGIGLKIKHRHKFKSNE